MSNIRRQSIISSGIVYFGFVLGFMNTYLFTRENSGFTKSEYGLIGLFVSVASIMSSFSTFGMQAFINKFFPYYKSHLKPRENDLMWVAFFTSFIGFVLIALGGWFFKDFVIENYGTNSPEFIKYYRWVFPLGFGLTFFSLLEALAWQNHRSVLTNFLKEVQFRLITTILIVLTSLGWMRDFSLLVKIYSFSYVAVALLLFYFLHRSGQLRFVPAISKLTRRFRKKIIALSMYIWGGTLVFTIANMFDGLVIAAVVPDGLAFTGIYILAQNMASLIQAPQRGIISASIGPLSQAWKDKDLEKIQNIYHRSSINQLMFSVAMFILIWINFKDGIATFHLQKDYAAAQQVFFFIGLMRILDMGTGVNSQIIGTSTLWRFEFTTGIILMTITLPMNYIFTKNMGVTGPAISNLITFTIYNLIRYLFLWKKYQLQPFNRKTLYVFAIGLVSYWACDFLFRENSGLLWIIARSSLFLLIFAPAVLILKISPDIMPVWQTIKKRLNKFI